MGGDIPDIMENFEGPRTIRYFIGLLMIVVGMLVIGSPLSSLYDIHWLEQIGMALANSPMVLLNLAGFLALIVLTITALPTILKYADKL